jgi:ATP-dependent Lon protease
VPITIHRQEPQIVAKLQKRIEELAIDNEALLTMIRRYTREAG